MYEWTDDGGYDSRGTGGHPMALWKAWGICIAVCVVLAGLVSLIF